jgi:drug/metabolite transporter (DMT)-like permease
MIGVGLILFVILSATLMKERVSKSDIIGIALIVIGLVIIGITTEEESRTWTYEEMVSTFSETKSIIFLVVTFLIAIGFAGTCILLKYKYADVLFGLSSGIFASFGAIFSKAFMTALDFGNFRSILIALGLLGWWFFFLGLIISNVLSLVQQQLGFQKGRGVILISIFNVLTVLVPTIAGIIMFGEWNHLDPNMITLKIISFGILFAGIVLLSIFTQKPNKSEI